MPPAGSCPLLESGKQGAGAAPGIGTCRAPPLHPPPSGSRPPTTESRTAGGPAGAPAAFRAGEAAPLHPSPAHEAVPHGAGSTAEAGRIPAPWGKEQEQRFREVRAHSVPEAEKEARSARARAPAGRRGASGAWLRAPDAHGEPGSPRAGPRAESGVCGAWPRRRARGNTEASHRPPHGDVLPPSRQSPHPCPPPELGPCPPRGYAATDLPAAHPAAGTPAPPTS